MDGAVLGTRQNYYDLVLRALEVHRVGFTHHQSAHFALDGAAGQTIDSSAEIACTDSKATFRKIRTCPLSNMLSQFSICDACVQPDSSSTAQDLVEQGGSGEAANRRIGMRDVDHSRMDDLERACQRLDLGPEQVRMPSAADQSQSLHTRPSMRSAAGFNPKCLDRYRGPPRQGGKREWAATCAVWLSSSPSR